MFGPAAVSSVQRISLLNRPANDATSLSCWLALPERVSADLPPIVAVHGIRRNASAQALLLSSIASEQGRPVIAPFFDEERWRRYQRVVIGGRADLALISLMEALREDGVWKTQAFELAGFSGGAQFAHRFAMLYPRLVARLQVASAGWYTFPDDAPFPYGFAARPGRKADWGALFKQGLSRFLSTPIRVFVGANDVLQDVNLRNGPAINQQQGHHRVERAERWVRALHESALTIGLVPDISLVTLPGCDHDFQRCVENGGLDRLIGADNGGIKEPSNPRGGPGIGPRVSFQ